MMASTGVSGTRTGVIIAITPTMISTRVTTIENKRERTGERGRS